MKYSINTKEERKGERGTKAKVTDEQLIIIC